MPFTTNGKRDYKKELEWEHKNENGGSKRVKDRAARNKARRDQGLKVGDSRQADHIKPLDSRGSKSKSNVQILSAKANALKEIKRKRSKPGNN